MKNVIEIRTLPTKCTKKLPKQFKQKENLSRTANALVLKASDLRQIQRHGQFLTEKQKNQRKRQMASERARLKEQARQHRERLAEIDRTRNCKKNKLDEEMQQEDLALKRELERKMKDFRTDQIDEVKQMRMIKNNALVVNVRDRQVQQKRAIHERERNMVKKLDLMMEIERKKKVRLEEQKHLRRVQDNLEGKRVIIEQMKANHLKRMRQKEEQEEEAKDILRRMHQLEEEERQNRLLKHQRQRSLRNTIEVANREAILRKQRALELEQKENAKIKEYLRQKQIKEEETLRRRKEAHDQKEREVARMREKQEKAHDRQQELDLIRARRAFQKGERAHREKLRRDAQQKAAMNRELNLERDRQVREKKEQRVKHQQKDRDLHEQMLRVNLEMLEKEKREKDLKKRTQVKNAMDLKKQIVKKAEKKLQGRRDKDEERKRIQNVRRARSGR